MTKTVYLGLIGDIIHLGLINIIHEEAKYGDLMIGQFTDMAIASHKRHPYLTNEQRKNVIESIKGVSEVTTQNKWSYVPNLQKYKPSYIIHGDNKKTNSEQELRLEVIDSIKDLGGEVIEIPYTKDINSSSLDKEMKAIDITPEDIRAFFVVPRGGWKRIRYKSLQNKLICLPSPSRLMKGTV